MHYDDVTRITYVNHIDTTKRYFGQNHVDSSIFCIKKTIQQTCTIQQFNLQATVEKEKPFFAAFRRNALCYAKSTMKLHLLFVAHK